MPRPLSCGRVVWAERSSSSLYTSVTHLIQWSRKEKWNHLCPELERHLMGCVWGGDGDGDGTSWCHCGGCGRPIGITLPGPRWQDTATKYIPPPPPLPRFWKLEVQYWNVSRASQAFLPPFHSALMWPPSVPVHPWGFSLGPNTIFLIKIDWTMPR